MKIYHITAEELEKISRYTVLILGASFDTDMDSVVKSDRISDYCQSINDVVNATFQEE